jgi:hypothetical protein
MGPRMKGLILWKIQHLSDFFCKDHSFVRFAFGVLSGSLLKLIVLQLLANSS